MKLYIFLIFTAFCIQGCYSSVGIGGGIPLGNSGVIGSTVQVGSDGRVHGNVGVGTAIRL